MNGGHAKCYADHLILLNAMFRHPEVVDRPSFREVVQALLEHEDSLLHIPPEALSSHSQAGMLGAPLEAGTLMYTDVQRT